MTVIDQITEINRVLVAVVELMNKSNFANLKDVIKRCESIGIAGRMPNHELTVLFSEKIGFLEVNGKNLRLTNDGLAFIELNPERNYELTENQKKLIIRTKYLSGILRPETMGLMKIYVPNYDKNTFVLSIGDNKIVNDAVWINEHLRQLGLLERESDSMKVTPEYVDAVASFLDEGVGFSEERFLKSQQEKIEVGDLTERLALNLEINRLIKLGHELESKCVRRISKLRINAGYDLESFDGKSKGIHFNRFIEVKGAKSLQMRFFGLTMK